MEEKVTREACERCGTPRFSGRLPSFWSEGFGPVEEYVHAAIEARRVPELFDPRLHRNQGYKGSGSCQRVDCRICEIMRRHGV